MDEALMLLLGKKDSEFITIKEICSKAGVNRSTLYLHYENTSGLLKECLENTNKSFLSYFEKGDKLSVEDAPLSDAGFLS